MLDKFAPFIYNMNEQCWIVVALYIALANSFESFVSLVKEAQQRLNPTQKQVTD
jgi:hypothetical protein